MESQIDKVSVATENPIQELLLISTLTDSSAAGAMHDDDDENDFDSDSDDDSVNEDDLDMFILELDMSSLSKRVQMLIGLQSGMLHRYMTKRRLCDLSAYNRIRAAVFEGLAELARLEAIIQCKEDQLWLAKQKKSNEKTSSTSSSTVSM